MRKRKKIRETILMRLNLGCGNDKREGYNNLDLPEIDLEKPLSFKDNSIEEIFLCHVIEHIKEHKRLLQECNRILQPSGRITIITPNYRGLGCRLALLLGKDYFLRDYNHVRFFTDKMILEEIKNAGLKIIRAKGNSKTLFFLPKSFCGETEIIATKEDLQKLLKVKK